MPITCQFIGVFSAHIGAGEETACYAVNGNILIDTGWNAAVSMQSCGLSPTAIDHVFFTHCHQDHTLGLPGIFFANSRRKESRPNAPPIILYGPVDLPLVLKGACEFLRTDQYPRCMPEHRLCLIYPGDCVDIRTLKVEVGRAFHPLDARSFRFTDSATGASIVFSGDTLYHEGLVEFAKGCDILIHEAGANPKAELSAQQRYLHSRPQDAARVACEAKVGELVLVHYSSSAGEAILRAAKVGFANSRLGIQGSHLELKAPGDWSWTLGQP